MKTTFLLLALVVFTATIKCKLEDDELFPWDIGDLTDDPVSEEDIFSKTKKYVRIAFLIFERCVSISVTNRVRVQMRRSACQVMSQFV